MWDRIRDGFILEQRGIAPLFCYMISILKHIGLSEAGFLSSRIDRPCSFLWMFRILLFPRTDTFPITKS